MGLSMRSSNSRRTLKPLMSYQIFSITKPLGFLRSMRSTSGSMMMLSVTSPEPSFFRYTLKKHTCPSRSFRTATVLAIALSEKGPCGPFGLDRDFHPAHIRNTYGCRRDVAQLHIGSRDQNQIALSVVARGESGRSRRGR